MQKTKSPVLKNYEIIEANCFFSTPFNFKNLISLEKYIYDNLGKFLITKSERAKFILKMSCSPKYDKLYNGLGYMWPHPVRSIMTKLMKIMRTCDSKNVMVWLNYLQSDENYRANLIKAYRVSGSAPSENCWKTCSVKFWNMPLGKPFHLSPCVIIIPSKNLIKEYCELDVFSNNFINNSKIKPRNNRFGIPGFCIYLDMQKFATCILDSEPEGYPLI